MLIQTEVEIEPFAVPTHVNIKQKPGKRQDGFMLKNKMELSLLDDETLSKLCDDFRCSVFENAGRTIHDRK